MTSRLWITRTEPDATRSARAWADVGFEPIVAPLLTIAPVAVATDIPDAAELIFTSSHGVRHCGIQPDARRIYTVGDATERAAREAGFTDVISASGDWKALVGTVQATERELVHIGGRTVRGTLVDSLRARGFRVSRRMVYESSPVTEWPLDPEQIDAVALYSPMASETLMALPPKRLDWLTAYCLSANVAAPLRGPRIVIADAPNEASLVACSRAADA